jgi:tetratricopeptide (TPR) repeat protein
MSSAAAVLENPQAGAGRPLPKKEGDLFRNVVKHYEAKQYKKAIKQADAILKKFPNHGETLVMKGLTLNYTSKKEEALALVKLGLMNDMKYVMLCYAPFVVLLFPYIDLSRTGTDLTSTRLLFIIYTDHTFVGTSTGCCTARTVITTRPLKPTSKP